MGNSGKIAVGIAISSLVVVIVFILVWLFVWKNGDSNCDPACQNGNTCDKSSSTCVCGDNSACGDGFQCVDGSNCECTNDSACDSGYICSNGKCVEKCDPPCTNSNICDGSTCKCGKGDPCTGEFQCISDKCQCVSDSACNQQKGEVCLQGECISSCTPSCQGSFSYCDHAQSSPQCESCETQCDVPSSDGCDKNSGICTCGIGAYCREPTPFCDTSKIPSSCIECLQDLDCIGSGAGKTCKDGICMGECLKDENCNGNINGPICDSSSENCVVCTADNTGCPDNFTCNTDKNMCFGCDTGVSQCLSFDIKIKCIDTKNCDAPYITYQSAVNIQMQCEVTNTGTEDFYGFLYCGMSFETLTQTQFIPTANLSQDVVVLEPENVNGKSTEGYPYPDGLQSRFTGPDNAKFTLVSGEKLSFTYNIRLKSNVDDWGYILNTVKISDSETSKLISEQFKLDTSGYAYNCAYGAGC